MTDRLARNLFRAYQNVDAESDEFLQVVEGEVPADLRGVLYRNGSGRMQRGGVYYGHPFDGDGMVSRFAFSDQGVHYRNRFVRTRWFQEEEAAGRILFRNFGTNVPGGPLRNFLRLRFKNAANTSVIHHAGRLLALWEGGPPHHLDPSTLETRGVWDFQGALADPDPLMRLARGDWLPFSAHPKLDPGSGDLFNFGVAMGLRPDLILYRVGADGAVKSTRRVKLPSLGFLHDFALTPGWSVFLLGPLSFDLAGMLLGLRPVMHCARFAPDRPSLFLLVPRDGGPPVELAAEPGFVFHFANAFEEGGRLVVDGLRYDRFPEVERFEDLPLNGFGDFPRMVPTRFRLDPAARSVETEVLSRFPGELPRIHPDRVGRPYRFFWCSAAPEAWAGPYLSGISKVDLETRETRFRDYAPHLTSEPLFVPRPGAPEEDDGWLLHTLYVGNEHRSELVVLNAADLSTVLRARLPHHESPGFHGTWVPEQAPAPPR